MRSEMKSILISIKPEYVEKILNGEKTIEIRKTKPNIELPCKVYIYCTKGKPTLQYFYNWGNYKPISEHSTWAAGSTINVGEYGNGKVVSEFTLNKIDIIEICDPDILINGKQCKQANLQKECQVSIDDIMSYIGYGDDHDGWGKDWDKGYLWHIRGLKIYDKPKELSEFVLPNKKNCKTCFFYKDMCENVCEEIKEHLFRPPQSWCYVESLEGE